MSDIFREVDEDLRRDQAVDIWKKYGPLFLAVAAVIVAGTALYRVYVYYERQKAEALGGRYQAALELSRTGKNEEAAKEFAAIASEGGAGYGVLARFRAVAELQIKDKAAAAVQFDALANDASIGVLLQGLARLRAATVLADTLSIDELKKRLEPLLPQGSAWGPNARELIGLATMKAGDLEAAGKVFDEVMTDPASPPSLKQRVEVYLALVKSGSKAP